MSLKKVAADLKERNIPQGLIQLIAPSQLNSLYWREAVNNPPKTTVEIWMLADSRFIIVQGDFSNGDWTTDDVSIIGEPYKNLNDALTDAKASYVLDPTAYDEVAKDQNTVEQPKAEEEPKEENKKTALKQFKRLIRKS